MSELLLDAAGRRRSPATLPQFHAGRPPRNKGMRYPADPPTIEEIVTVMRRAGDSVHGPPPARPDRRALARRFAHPRGARPGRGRPGRAPRVAAGAPRQGRTPPRGRHGRLGLGAARAIAAGARRVARRAAVLRRQRPHARAALGARRRRALRATACGSGRRRAATLRAPPAAPRARRRDGPRGRAADRHPAPARPHQPRHHLDLSPRHRQHRDHRHRPRPPRPDGAGPQLAGSQNAPGTGRWVSRCRSSVPCDSESTDCRGFRIDVQGDRLGARARRAGGPAPGLTAMGAARSERVGTREPRVRLAGR